MTRTSQWVLGLASLCFLMAGCSDSSLSTGPSQIAFAKGGKSVTRDATASSTTTEAASEGTTEATACGGDGLEPLVLRHRADAPPLRKYERSYRAVQGRSNMFDVYYVDGTWFMSLQIPPNAQLLKPDGEPAAKGETVIITATIDPELFEVSFQPHGSSFTDGQPATLQFSLDYADIGNCDPSNAKVWYQPSTAFPWESLNTTWSAKSYWVEADLYHFSNYAVAW